ncbi:hypothetical protein [Chiayiivirga flava]|uniref:NTF2 fold immunity protein domain-containing protein n=1 Tax=Chiayiivirga flava TaxID=659595 RepID=A0A7W8G015_9GAMM|nr:hypothetical protein [Chiayiivirga flava]MBB5208701.1 hypothetical protein [Chiayiivirga flava]
MQRALERWSLLIKHEAGAAWEYLSPGYREVHPKDVYAEEMSRRPVRWTKVEPYQTAPDEEGIGAVQCNEEGTVCDLRLRVYFKIRSHLTSVGLIDNFSVVKESWIKVKGRWYLVPQDAS